MGDAGGLEVRAYRHQQADGADRDQQQPAARAVHADDRVGEPKDDEHSGGPQRDELCACSVDRPVEDGERERRRAAEKERLDHAAVPGPR